MTSVLAVIMEEKNNMKKSEIYRCSHSRVGFEGERRQAKKQKLHCDADEAKRARQQEKMSVRFFSPFSL